MDTELFMECEEEELEPWQQVDDSVDEDDMDFVDHYGEPIEDSPSSLPSPETPPPRPSSTSSAMTVMLPPPLPHSPFLTSSLPSITHTPPPTMPAVLAPPLVTQGPPLILTQTASGTFLLPAGPRTGSTQPILLTAQTNMEGFRFEDGRGRTFESRGEMVMCGGCGGKFFRIVSHLKKSRTCSSHLDLDTFEKLLLLYNRKRKRKSDTKGFPVQTVMNPGAPLVLNLQPGQTVQPFTLIQSSTLGQLVRPSVAVTSVHPQGQTVQTKTAPSPFGGTTQPGSAFMQLPATLTIHGGSPRSLNLNMTKVCGTNSMKLTGCQAPPTSSANGVSRQRVIGGSSSTAMSSINEVSRHTPVSVTTPSVTPATPGHAHKVVMSVEEFYYGTYEGDLSLRKPLPPGIQTSTFTCQICTHLADNNLRLMQHMLQHSKLIGGGGGDDKKCCRFCYRQFSSESHLQTHQVQVHGSAPSSSLCRICEWAFENEPAFLNHMKSNHKPGEMPYVCQVCSYRSSFYSDVLRHFASFHGDSRFLLCVFCLKVTRNPLTYQEHLTRHQITQAFHCNRCRLQFVVLQEKMQHKLENHCSFRRPPQLQGLPPGSKVTIRTYGKCRSPLTSSGGRCLQSPTLIQPINIKTEPQKLPVERSPAPCRSPRSPNKRQFSRRVNRASMLDSDRLVCLECGTDASDLSAHYPSHVRCLLCSFSSCCSRAFAAHMIQHHVPRVPVGSTRRKIPLHKLPPPCVFLLQCSSCDFRPLNADVMANHLLKNPDHYSATCRIRSYMEPDIRFCCNEELCCSEEKKPDWNPDLPDQYWRSGAGWKRPEENADGSGSMVAEFSEVFGPCHSLTKSSDAIDFFNLLFPSALVELITKETNTHAKTRHYLDSVPLKWVPVTTHEIKGFMGLVILMGIQNLPDPSHYWCWSHYDNSYTFYRAMSFKRFKQIADNIRMGSWTTEEHRGTDNPSDALHIFRPMLKILSGAMWATYRPNCCLTIDRALLPGLEAENFKKNPKTQPQVWLLCDSKSGYCHRFFIQMGENMIQDLGFTVVPELVKGLEDKHHQLFLANSLTSVPLMQKLLSQGIYASSSFPPPSSILPRELWDQGWLEKPGDFLQRQCGPLLATRWKDTKEMGCLSTNAAPGEPDTVWRRSQTKVGGLDPIDRPLAFSLLQENMRGVDICKQLLACNPLGGIPLDRTWRSLFWFLVNLSVVNAFIILRESRKETPPPWVQDGLFTQVNFRKRLGNQLAKCAQTYFETIEMAGSRGMRKKAEAVGEVKQRHRLVKISSISKRCSNCNLKNLRRETVSGCCLCRVSLCKRSSCFWEFHRLSPTNRGLTKVGFVQDARSGAVEVEDNMDAEMAPVDADDEDLEELEDLDEDSEDLRLESTDVDPAVSDPLLTTNGHAHSTTTWCPSKEQEDSLTARQLRVVLFALCDGLRQASRVFSIEPRIIQTWLKDAEQRPRQSEQEENIHGAGANGLVSWVLSMREQELPITESSLFHKASSQKKKGIFTDSFRISYDWAVNFMLQHRLGPWSLSTTNKPAPTLPPSLEAKMVSFRGFTNKLIRAHSLCGSSVAAMDELCFFVDLRLVQDESRRSEALELTGTVPLVTVYLAALADGSMLPSLVLANRQLDNKVLPEFILLEAGPESLLVEEALDLWINKVWHQHVFSRTQSIRSILVLDRHREHMCDQFLTSISSSGTLPAVIPAGCSFRLQPLEVCMKPILQRFMLQRWREFTTTSPQDLENMSPQQLPTRVAQLLVDWLIQALTLLNKLSQIWKNSFKLTGLLPKDRTEEETSSQRPEDVRQDLLQTVTESLMGSEALQYTFSELLYLEEKMVTAEESEGQRRPEDGEDAEKKDNGETEDNKKNPDEVKMTEEDSEEEGKETQQDRKETNKDRRETRIVIGEEVGDEWKIKSRTEGVDVDNQDDG